MNRDNFEKWMIGGMAAWGCAVITGAVIFWGAIGYIVYYILSSPAVRKELGY